MNLRVDAEGFAVKEGAQIEVGGNERYVALVPPPLCREQMGWRRGTPPVGPIRAGRAARGRSLTGEQG